ncbi:phosphate regulon sensor histidine kinase PhoR [Rhizobium sp. SSA_523]|uniref:phosphate regulon sensor histidine kinase PhoR n=1 Tax=Rhizobium sp. SSA_523 TaxID=2952477 RepID=UPI002090FE0E|nr:phosphate regulon sensor histidine kinase PhoR [Rhizobium sp. SSA_523]MCO5732562.1 phosphate regulon sensor histidine kinase PhoR [Rhizobium sp. SSA_523]WKC23797.1 phosphate regulon sensor histidine kinase PhoR [Rhizobium sp. SSA_523]
MALGREKESIRQTLWRGWLVVAAATLLAALALAAEINPLFVAAGWLLIMICQLLSPAMPMEQDKNTLPPPPLPDRDPLSDVSDAYAALDLPVILLGEEGQVLFQNSAAERAFEAMEPGSHLSARLRSPGILDMVRETIATGQANQIEHSERHPSERVYILRVAPIASQNPRQDGAGRLFALTAKDISELRRIDRMRSDFVANASHELRTPLASLRGFIETLQGPAKGDPGAHERFLAIMLDQATRMSRLVDDLLSLSRLELKAHIAPSQRVDLVPLIGHVRDALQPLADDLGVDIRMHLPEGKVEVIGDRDELVQVIENLVENACKYGQDGKVVEIHLRHDQPGRPVELSVVDRGPGIPAEHVPRLTERFYRVSVADSRSKKGTGLGLAIVKHILTRHRARLIVKSEIGKGTDFTVRF